MTLAAAVGDGERITDDQIVTDLMTVVDGVRETDKVRVNLAKSHGIGNPPIFLEETPGLETKVKDAARRIWEKFGEPRGRDQEIWNRARAQIYLENLTRPSIPISARNSFGDDDNGGDDRTK